MEIQNPQQLLPFEEPPPRVNPARPELIMITLGGSHRSLARAGNALQRAGVPFRSVGPVALYSKRVLFVIPSRCLDSVLALGIGAARAREQWAHVQASTEAEYFQA
jgi:hypothetical protein